MSELIDTSRFGDNLFRSKMTQENGVLKIAQRGWLFGIVFGIIASVMAYIIHSEEIPFAGFWIFLYLVAGGFFLIAILYGLYVQEIYFDMNRKILIQRRGFFGFVKRMDTEFSEVKAITAKEVTMNSASTHSRAETTTMWDIGIRCSRNQPVFDFWRTTEKDIAEHILNTLKKVCKSKIDWIRE